MTTITAFVAGVASMDIEGVKTQYGFEPFGVETADMPATFPRLPDSSLNEGTLTTCDGGRSRTVVLTLVVDTTGQELSAELWERTVTMADYFETALETLENASALMPMITWSLSCTPVVLKNEVEYSAIIATITGTE